MEKVEIFKFKRESWKYAHYFSRDRDNPYDWWSLCWQANGRQLLDKSFDTTKDVICPICESRFACLQANQHPITKYKYVSHELDEILGLA